MSVAMADMYDVVDTQANKYNHPYTLSKTKPPIENINARHQGQQHVDNAHEREKSQSDGFGAKEKDQC